MPKLKNYGPGKRINIWIPEKYMPMLDGIENRSKFFQLCLEDVIGIMTWGILRENNPDKYKKNTGDLKEVSEVFNKTFPLDPLTEKRLNKNKCPENSANKQELW